MEFSKKKLPREAALELRRVPLYQLTPYALMLTPVYVFLKKNNKFLAVKGPLDFFEPKEITKLGTFYNVFLTPFILKLEPFQNAAASVKAILNWQPKRADRSNKAYPEVPLPPAPFENSDAILQLIAPLWGRGTQIETFFVCAFVEELVEPIPKEFLLEARATNVEAFDRALFISSWVVFLALHLGHCEINYLTYLRLQTFRKISLSEKIVLPDREVCDLLTYVEILLEESEYASVRGRSFQSHPKKVAQKLSYRVHRIVDDFLDKAIEPPTIIGPEGIKDA